MKRVAGNGGSLFAWTAKQRRAGTFDQSRSSTVYLEKIVENPT